MDIIKINQSRAIAFGLTLSESVVLGYLVERSDYCDWFSIHLMTAQLPLVSSKYDSLYRIVRSLVKKNAIKVERISGSEYRFYFLFHKARNE